MSTIHRRTGIRLGTALPILIALGLGSGCREDAGHNINASPVVKPDSEQAKQAISESEELLRLRKEQEAKSRRRVRNVPESI